MVVDRIEGSISVIEVDGRTFDIPTTLLPKSAREGDKLRLVLDSEDSKKTEAEAEARLRRLQSTDHESDHIDL